MKKFLLLLLVLPLTALLSGCSFGETMLPLILEKNNNVLTIFALFEETESVEVYDLTLSPGCPIDSINQGDLLGIELAEYDVLNPNDNISGTLPLSALDFTNTDEADLSGLEETDFENCTVETVTKYDGTYGLIAADYLAENEYIVSETDETTYIMNLPSNCIYEQTGPSALLITEQNTSQINENDKIMYGIDVTSAFAVNKIENCLLNSLDKVYGNESSFISADQNNNTLFVNDNTQFIDYEIEVDSSCELLTKDLNETGAIYYADPYNTDPLFVQFMEVSNDLELDFNINGIACEIKEMNQIEDQEVIDQSAYYNLPIKAYLQSELDLSQYQLIGKYQKKVHSSRPDSDKLAGYIVKGQTDPATYTVDQDGNLRWMKNEQVAKRLYGDDWDSQIIWFSDAIIYTYQFGEPIQE